MGIGSKYEHEIHAWGNFIQYFCKISKIVNITKMSNFMHDITFSLQGIFYVFASYLVAHKVSDFEVLWIRDVYLAYLY